MKLILFVFVAILVAIPVGALLVRAVRLLVLDLPRDRPGVGWPVLGLAVAGAAWLAWRLTHVHWHHRWR